MQKVHILSTDRECLEKVAYVSNPAFSLVVLNEPERVVDQIHDSSCLIIDEAFSGEFTANLLNDLFVGGADLPVLILLSEADVTSAVRYTQLGALDCIPRPVQTRGLVHSLTRAILTKRSAIDEESVDSAGISGITGSDRHTVTLRKRLSRIAGRNSSVLIYGESGSGKDVVSRAIHRLSPRADRPYLAVNVAAIPGALFESELFGVARGAYTGAVERDGVFTFARGGTVFLDEIGELALEHQVKLLRVIEEKVVTPLGSRIAVPVDFRLVSATNRNLSQMVRDGTFRRDLYYRLSTAPVRIFPLRDRPDDLWPLVAEFFHRQNMPAPPFSTDAREMLAAYTWPGNVRELYNVLERSLIYGDGERVRGSDIVFDEV